ncbi:hypothetical protein [Roseococcus sp. YIM B11640]|uniref:hypothetical protein n=1 Tax=Roseococcus sp. YIM B11640 TaxID=3133973 RepID=UPI003C797900
MLILHLSLSVLALVSVLAVLTLPKGRGSHRWLGRIAGLALVGTALASFGVRSHGHFTYLHLLSVATLLTVPYAVWMVRQGHVARHRRIMLINAGGLFVAGLAATMAPGRYLHGIFFG